MNKKVDRFSPEALDLLTRYPWPGNLRELENVIERSVVLASTREVGLAHLPLHLQESGPLRASTDDGFLEAKERAIAVFEREAVSRFLCRGRGKYLPGGQAGAHYPAKLPPPSRRNTQLIRRSIRLGITSPSSGTYTTLLLSPSKRQANQVLLDSRK